MLGIQTKKHVITGKYAKWLKEQINRIAHNSSEQSNIPQTETGISDKKYEVAWD